MADIVVAVPGPLIALSLVGLLPCLPRLFQDVYVPEAVLVEPIRNLSKPGAKEIANALETGLLARKYVSKKSDITQLSLILDQGEAEALTIAKELGVLVLIDEKQARKYAVKMGIRLIGSSAILITAKRKGLIDAVKPRLELLNTHGYRLSPSLVGLILKACNEEHHA